MSWFPKTVMRVLFCSCDTWHTSGPCPKIMDSPGGGGEVGCCESQMAERIHWWTERWLECRTIHLSIHLSIHPSIYPSFLSTDLPIYQPILPSICLALYLSMQPSIHHPILSMCPSVYLSFYFSLSRSVHFLISPSVCLHSSTASR